MKPGECSPPVPAGQLRRSPAAAVSQHALCPIHWQRAWTETAAGPDWLKSCPEIAKCCFLALEMQGEKKIPSSCIRAVCHSCAICSTCNINQQPVVRSDSSAFDGYGESQINKLYAASGLSVRFLSSSVVHLHGQSALQDKRRCPSLLLVFWGGPAFPAQGWDAGAGAPRRGPAERGACQPECLAEKMLDFGLRSLPWQLLSVSTEVTLGGEELWQPGGRLPAGPLGCCILWNNRPTENDTNAWRGLRCFSLTSDYISCSALNSQPDFWRHPSTNTCKLRAVVLAGSFAWGSHSSGAAAHGVWRCGAGASARLSCRPLSFMDEVWKMCVHYRRVLNSSAWKLWWSKFHLKKNNN